MVLPARPAPPARITITLDTERFDDALGRLGIVLSTWQRGLTRQLLASGTSTTSPAAARRYYLDEGRRRRSRSLDRWVLDEAPGPGHQWQRPPDERDIALLLPTLARLIAENERVQQAWSDAWLDLRGTTPDEDSVEVWARWQALGEQLRARKPRDLSAELAAHAELLPCVDLVDGYRFGVREVSAT